MSRVAFPGLGIEEFNIDPVAFTLFGREIYWYGIVISFAFLVCIGLALRDSKKFGVRHDDIIDFTLFVIPAAVVGARLFYVAFKWEEYAGSPLDIFAIWNGGLGIYGAILVSIVTAYIFAKRRKLSILRFFDFVVPYLALGQAVGRWGNFFNVEAYGTQTTLPWRMEITAPDGISTISVHPTFLYESLWNLGVFALLIWYRKRNKLPGEVFLLYMVLYGVGRFWIEGLRIDSLMLGGFRVSQLLAGVFAVSLAAVIIIRRKRADALSKASTGKGDNITSIDK